MVGGASRCKLPLGGYINKPLSRNLSRKNNSIECLRPKVACLYWFGHVASTLYSQGKLSHKMAVGDACDMRFSIKATDKPSDYGKGLYMKMHTAV